MESLIFEGKEIKPWKDGKFRCPFNCHRIDYPRPKWATEKGFLKHLEQCQNAPTATKKREDESAIRDEKYQAVKAEILSEFPHKIGDTLHAVREIIVRPTHVESSTGRMRRVRYEAEKKFEACTFELKSIDFARECGSLGPEKKYVIQNSMLLNRSIRPSDVCSSFQEAQEKAKKMQEGYDKAVEFASYCR